jgi:CRISPR system Cascade subunit CasE
MIYLSRLLLNPSNREVRLDLANCHDLHSRIMTAFPFRPELNGNARAELGVLYRVEPADRAGALPVLVQSAARPEWGRLPAGYLAGSIPECKQVDQAYASIRSGREFVFRLRANPTKRLRKVEGSNDNLAGKRVHLLREEEWQQWIARKGDLGGFQVLTVNASATDSVPDIRTSDDITFKGTKTDRRTGKRMRMTFGSVLFEGRLRVTDADLFRDTLRQGIGSGKAYGFGLLSIAPAS